MKLEDLLKIVGDDDLSLLKVKPAGSGAMAADARLVASFREIEEFVKKNGREPQANHADVHEFRLNSRLAGIRASKAKVESLMAIDTQGLLGKPLTDSWSTPSLKPCRCPQASRSNT